ncbi:hypothetical protein BGX28_005489 [Mortierella sp. GBA30]|nr:hypothetical protein BGX28_005489 [Mortierella sp. GBA30]
MTYRLSNTVNSFVGSAKQTVGESIGNPDLAAKGAAQKAQANTAQQSADAQIHAQGVGNTVQGEVQKKVGAITNDPAMEARGHGNVALGDAQRNI